MDNFRTTDYWKTQLGLLPVPLHSGDTDQFVMLNGLKGNFCADFSDAADPSDAKSIAWACNTAHYVQFGPSSVALHSIASTEFEPQKIEIIKITENLERFHLYLERHSDISQPTVVQHYLRVFRTLRTLLGPEHTGEQALSAYTALIACSASNTPFAQIEAERWGIKPFAQSVVGSIRSADWQSLQALLQKSYASGSTKNYIDLAVRHSAGIIFQEAHFEATYVHPEQLTFDGILPHATRAANKPAQRSGVHFTPPFIARTVVEQILRATDLKKPRITVFDPACGSGEFLREVLRQLSMKSFIGHVHIMGFDISQGACDLADFVLSNEARQYAFKTTKEIRCCNSLSPATQWPARVDMVVMNPPFVAWDNLSEEQKDLVKDTLGELSQMRTDLSHAFLYKALDCVIDGGHLASIIPATFLDSKAAAKLRAMFMERCPPRFVARLGNHSLFSSAIVDPAFFVATKAARFDGMLCTWADHRHESTSSGLRNLRMLTYSDENSLPIVGDGFNIYKTNDIPGSDQIWNPKPYDAVTLSARFSALPRCGDLFETRQGVITGLNEAFLISSQLYASLPTNEQEYFKPAITNDAINFGYLDSVKHLFYPHGKRAIKSEEQLLEVVPTFAETHLLQFKDRLKQRKRIAADKWFTLTEHRSWQRADTPKIVSTYFGSAGSFAYDMVGSYAVVQGYAWIPKNNQEKEDPTISCAYLALFNSQFFFKLLSAVSNPVAGGQLNLSKRYVSMVPVPDLHGAPVNSSIVFGLSDFGLRMTKGMSYDFDHLNTLVARAYGEA